jgi:hypothetical protein
MKRQLQDPRCRIVLLSMLVAIGVLAALGGNANVSAEYSAENTMAEDLVYPSHWISGSIIVPIVPGWPFPCPRWPSVPPPPGVPTPQPRPTPTPGPATGLTYQVCPQIVNKVPAAIQQEALASPWKVYGYGQRLNPNVPYHPLWNPYKTWLTILDYGKPWNPCNPIVWKAGCP